MARGYDGVERGNGYAGVGRLRPVMGADFSKMSAALAARAAAVAEHLLPEGRREGGEWRCGGIDGGAGRSLSVALHGPKAGVWYDHASGEGGDLLALWAACRARPLPEAAREASRWLGTLPASDPPAARYGPSGAASAAFVPTVPIPPDAPPLPAHPRLGRASATWCYRSEAGAPLFHVARFDLSDGSKQVLPLVYGRLGDRYGWHWRAFPLLRPLYRLDDLAARPGAPVLVVEGEKAAEAAARLLPDHVAVTWPGGSNAVQAADWRPLKGRRCVLWPDHDRPGIEAMRAVAEQLSAVGAVEVRVVALPDSVPQKWDAADCAAEANGAGKARALVDEAPAADGPPSAQEAPKVEPWPTSSGDVSAMLSTPPAAMSWFVDERLECGRAVLLTGIGGSSKSRALYHLAIGAVLGRLPWDWAVANTGRAVLLLTEDVPGDVHRTLWATLNAISATEAERTLLAERLLVFPLAGEDCRLLDLRPGGALEPTARLRGLVERLRGLDDLVFIGLDPALSLTAGDELNQGHQRTLGKLADDLAIHTGAAVVLVSHAAKGSQALDELGSHASRGGGAITDAVRGEFVMRTMTAKEAARAHIEDAEERRRLVQLVATKGNHLPPVAFLPLWLRRGDGGALAGADVDMAAPGSVAASTPADMNCLSVLVELCAVTTPPLRDWRAECVRRGLIPNGTPAAVEKAFQRVTRRLLDDSFITRALKSGAYVPTQELDDGA